MNMNGQINLICGGISIGIILTYYYFIYTQHNQMAENKPVSSSKAKQNQIMKISDDTVFTAIAKVPNIADDLIDIGKFSTNQYKLYELFWKKIGDPCEVYVRPYLTYTKGRIVNVEPSPFPPLRWYTIRNQYQFACSHQVRFGHRASYEVCLDESYRPGKPCIVYSFGSFFLFDFEEFVIKHHQCEVHTYDPSHPIANHVIPQGVNFHLVGLGDKVTTNSEGWKMQTFSDIRRTLKHTQKTIDILKIDIEGGEWLSLTNALRSGELKFVKQLLIELYLLDYVRTGMSLFGQLEVLKQLYEQGFRIFYHEPYFTRGCVKSMRNPHPQITLCVILSFVNIKYQPY